MIFCVEDDASIREIELYALRSTGLEAKGFKDGGDFLAALEIETPELVILDVMLPGIDGVELLRRMKASGRFADIPIIMATAKGEEYDKVQSLDLGADDYLVKPFGMMEMVSRVKAVLRRCHPASAEKRLSVGGVTIDLEERTVTSDGARVALTYKEFELLRLFLSRPGAAFTREQLLSDVWGVEYVGYVRHKTPVNKRRIANLYTEAGKAAIHDNLRIQNQWVMTYTAENPIPGLSVEYSDNRVFLFAAQYSKCAMTGEDFYHRTRYTATTISCLVWEEKIIIKT